MNKLALLKYLGITPVVPNRAFPGAASSQQCATAQALHLKQPLQAHLTADSPSLAVSAIKREHNVTATPRAEHTQEMPVDDAQAQQPLVTPQALNKVETERAHDELMSAQVANMHTAEASNPHPLATAHNADQAVACDIVVLRHAQLNVLVMAEIVPHNHSQTSGVDAQTQLQLLKKIVLSFSQGQDSHWQSKKFSWPLKTNKYTPLENNIVTASDTFLGYTEALQPSAPAKILCFHHTYLAQLLGGEKKPPADSTQPGISQAVTTDLWAGYELRYCADLSVYAQDKTAKTVLWNYIKKYLINA